MSKVKTNKIQHVDATGTNTNIELDSSRNVTCKNDLTVDGDLNVTGTSPTDLISDTSPQLGGNLDCLDKSITTTTTNGSIIIQAAGTGKVEIHGGSQAKTKLHPNSGGTSILTTHNTTDLVLDTNEGTNSGNITIEDGANNDIKLTPNGTGDVVIDGLKYPQADGSAGQVLKTDGSAQLSWTTVSGGVGSDAQNNTVAGASAGAALDNDTDDNTCVGYHAGKLINSGDKNTCVGSAALDACLGGGSNTAIGYGALGGLESGGDNTAVGVEAGASISSAGSNTCIGKRAGYVISTGEHNVAIGAYALDASTGTGSNVAVGNYALTSLNNGAATGNVAVGHKAGETITGGEHNTIVGWKAGDTLDNGYSNVAIGSQALAGASTGNRCTAGGRNALLGLTTGLEATAFGFEAGLDYNANGGVFLGRWAGKTNATDQNTVLYIARNADSAGNNGTWIYGNDTGQCVNGDNSTAWATESDRRLKKDIVDNNVGLSVINNVRVRNFKYKQYDKSTAVLYTLDDQEVKDELKQVGDEKSPSVYSTPKTSDDTIDVSSFNSGATVHNLVIGQGKTGVQLGVIAQELETVAPNCVRTDDFGAKTVCTDELFWNMINSIKELSTKNDALEARIAALESA